MTKLPFYPKRSSLHACTIWAKATQPAHLADLRISIAEADAREAHAVEAHRAQATALTIDGVQQKTALNTWEDEGGAPMHLKAPGGTAGAPREVFTGRPRFDY